MLNNYSFASLDISRDGRQRLKLNKEIPGHTGLTMIMDAVNDEDGMYYSIVTIKPLSKKQAEKEKALSFQGERSPQGQFPVAGASGAPVGFFTGTAGGLVASNDSAFGALSIADGRKYVNDYYYDSKKPTMADLGIVNNYNQPMPDKKNFYTIQITGQEFGKYSDLKELRQKALQWYGDNLQGTDAYNPVLGKIRIGKGFYTSNVNFTRRGRQEMKGTAAKPLKMLVVPNLKEIIENSNFITEAASTKEKHKNEYFYYLHVAINTESGKQYVLVTIKEDEHKNLAYYIHNVFTEEEYKKIEDAIAEPNAVEVSNLGASTQEAPSFTNSITGKAKVYKQQSVVYNQTAYHGSPINRYNQEAELARKGSIGWDNDGKAIITMFRGRDASTVIHETGHYFVESLARDVKDGKATKQQLDDWRALLRYVGLTNDEEKSTVLNVTPGSKLRPVLNYYSGTLEDGVLTIQLEGSSAINNLEAVATMDPYTGS